MWQYSFPFGWLFLPVDLIGRPFSQKTRDHFLPLLTSTAWWSQTSIALKRVFQNDNDFKERMFAKQLAVMKGQAWNVVEALKTPDHGPLELTRRTKVCVWDDLVDVPVAVPMRMTSSERRHAAATAAAGAAGTSQPRESMDEADIAGSAPANQAKIDDLLGLSRSSVDMPHPGRFEISTPGAEEGASPLSPLSETNEPPLLGASAPRQSRGSLERPPIQPQGHLASYHGPGRGSLNMYEPSRHQPQKHKRRFSFTPAIRRSSSSIAQRLYDGDDLEGDLGYAAAEGQMGSQRKVIVERLEAVKSKNPVFTWC
jgi:phosphatidylinositol 4-kinase type 2